MARFLLPVLVVVCGRHLCWGISLLPGIEGEDHQEDGSKGGSIQKAGSLLQRTI